MASLHWVWKWLSNKKISCSQYLRARRELATLLLGSCLFHTFLGASVSNTATASDASGTGGAIGQSTKFTEEGQDFGRALTKTAVGCPRVPVLVLSLFNGIGGAFRAYDLVGAKPAGLIGFDVSKPATRVTSRRWPHAVLKGDVREIDKKMVKGWLLQYPHVTQVDVWAGFPCVDLSAVKLGRLNLRGEHSGLFSEVLRVELLPQVFGRRSKIYFYVENVSSMDKEAAHEISMALGVKPFKLQSPDAVPISRPRFCWTNKDLPWMKGVTMLDKGDYFEIVAECEYPLVQQWI